MMDPDLLADLDATDEVQREGRSAVLRRAASEYLERRRSMQIRDGYVRAYGEGDPTEGDLAGWADEGVWPDE